MKFVIFDIDGTLSDTKKVEDKCFMSAFHQTFKIDITSQKWHDLKNVTDWGITEEIIQREFKRTVHPEEYTLMNSNFLNLLRVEKKKDPTQFGEVAGARQFFNYLKDQTPFALGIATGSWEDSAKLKLSSIGIELHGVSFSNSSHHKSREEITKDVIGQLEKRNATKAEEIIYFGDGEWDYKTCNNLGIKFIGIDILGDGKLSKLGAKTVFRNYLNKDEILKSLVG